MADPAVRLPGQRVRVFGGQLRGRTGAEPEHRGERGVRGFDELVGTEPIVGGRRDAGVVQRGAHGDGTAAIAGVHGGGVLRIECDPDFLLRGVQRPRLDISAGRRPLRTIENQVERRRGRGTGRGVGGGFVEIEVRIGKGVEGLFDIEPGAARTQRPAQADPAHRRRDTGRAEHHIAAELRPAVQGLAHLDQAARHPGGQIARAEQPHDIGCLVPGGQAAQLGGGDIAEQAVEGLPPRFEVETFDIEQAAVAGFHDQR